MAYTSTPEMSLDTRSMLHGNAVCFGGILLFAMGFPALEVLLQSWGSVAVITARIILANLLLVPLWLLIEGRGALSDIPIRRGLWIGAVGFGIGTVILVVVQDMTDAVTAAIMVTILPVFAVLLEVLYDGRRLRPPFVAGIICVLIGGYLATGAAGQSAQFGIGAALGAFASAIFAWGSRAAVKELPQMTPLGQTTLTFFGTMLFCCGVYVGFLALGLDGIQIGTLGSQGWSLLLIYAWGAMALSQLLWIAGVGRLGVAIASFHLNAVPFYVMVILFAFGGSWDWVRAGGAVLLGLGVILAQRRSFGVLGH